MYNILICRSVIVMGVKNGIFDGGLENILVVLL